MERWYGEIARTREKRMYAPRDAVRDRGRAVGGRRLRRLPGDGPHPRGAAGDGVRGDGAGGGPRGDRTGSPGPRVRLPPGLDAGPGGPRTAAGVGRRHLPARGDRKSTRLNSSHVKISYA